jgi:hypothetical protein
MPSAPTGLRFQEASLPYLQSLTAYFFPAVTTQLANVHCQRSWKTSLFSRAFINPTYRREALDRIVNWRPPHYTPRVRIDFHVRGATEWVAVHAFIALAGGLLFLPFRILWMLVTQLLDTIERPLMLPLTAWLARFLERHYILFNFISNPLIDLGILFELALCYLFFYTPIAEIYYFAPVPWHVYVFAFHGTVLLLLFEEIKKYYRRRGYGLDFLG